ncbi:MAG: hypothetical protein PWQ23_978 [Thermoanaerobacter sp.]|jgi:hypothetical protein|nr:hypothetical protein [Thermoanaerobacter sp.]
MKKFFTFFFVVLLITSLVSTAFGSTLLDKDNIKIIEKHKEISDLNLLTKRAKEGVTDLKLKQPAVWVFKNLQTNEEKYVQSLDTTQLLSVYEISSGIVREYKTTFILDVNNDNLKPDASINPSAVGSGSNYKSAWDPSLSVKAYSTIYWETYDINGYEHITLTAVSGGWIVEDPTVWLSSREVYVSQNGRYEGYPKQLVSYTKYFYPTSNYYYYNLSSYGWLPVRTDISHGYGSTSWVTLHRGTSSEWVLMLNNGYVKGY